MKESHRSVRILQNISKIFEWFMFKQVFNLIEPPLSKQQYGLRKSYIFTQYCLYPYLKNGNQQLIKENILLRAFYRFMKDICFSDDFLLAKLRAFGFNLAALRFALSCLTSRIQTTKVNVIT